MKKKFFNINLVKKHDKNCSGPLTQRDFGTNLLNNESVDDFVFSKTLSKLFSHRKNMISKKIGMIHFYQQFQIVKSRKK